MIDFSVINEIIENMSVFSACYFFFIGASLASFLGFCVYRYTIWLNAEYESAIHEAVSKGKKQHQKVTRSLFDARSSCDHCEVKIPIWYNIPFIGYLLLRGKTSCCNQRLSPRHLMNEAYLGVLTVCYIFLVPICLSSLLFYLLIPLSFLLAEIDRQNKILPESLIGLMALVFIGYSELESVDISTSLIIYMVSVIAVHTLYFAEKAGYYIGKGDLSYLALIAFISGYTIDGLYALLVISAVSLITKNISGESEIRLGWSLQIGLMVLVYLGI